MQHEKKVFLLATPYGGNIVSSVEMVSTGYVTLSETVAVFDVPDYDENQVAIMGLEYLLKHEQAETEMKQQKLKNRIAELQCITHKPD